MSEMLGLTCSFLSILALIVLMIWFVSFLGKEPVEPNPPEKDPRTDELIQLRTTVSRINDLVEQDLLDAEVAAEVKRAVDRRYEMLGIRKPRRVATAQQMVLEVIEEREKDADRLADELAATPIPPLPLLKAVEVIEPPTPPAPTAPVPVPVPEPVPRQSWGDLLGRFMEEKNILWGELVGGLLIVGCSIALVISLWQTLEEIPYFPFIIFSSISLALFGAGQYTLHHWKLESTSRGLLVITSLLLPLNLLVLAGIARGIEGGVTEIAVTASALLLFGFVARKSGEAAIGGDGWTLPLAIVGAAAAPLLLPWLTHAASTWPAILAGVATGFFALAVMTRLRALPAEGSLHPIQVRSLFLFIGMAGFAAGAVVTFLVARTSAEAGTLRPFAGPLSPAGIAFFLVGLLLQRRLTGTDEGMGRSGATGLALVGLLIVVAALGLAWTLPGLLLAVAVLNALVLATFAFRWSLPWVHGLALPCTALATLIGYHLLAGNLDVGVTGATEVAAALLSSDSTIVLSLLAIALAVGAELLIRRERQGHAFAWGIGGLSCGIIAVLLVSLHGIAEPGRAAFVYFLLAVSLLIADLRWGKVALAAVGQILILTGSIWLLVWIDPKPTDAWGLLLAVETLLLAVLAIRRQRDQEAHTPRWYHVLTTPCHELTALAGMLTITLILVNAEFPRGNLISLSSALLAASAILWAWVARNQAGFWIASILLCLGLSHFLEFGVAVDGVIVPGLTALLLTATIVLIANLLLQRSHYSEIVREVFAIPAAQATILFSGLSVLAVALMPKDLPAQGIHLLWVGLLWLVLSWSNTSPGWWTAGQSALSLAVVVLSCAWVEAQGVALALEEPLLLQTCGIALGLLGLVWLLARRKLRHSATARVLFAPPWVPPDRILVGVLPGLFLLMSVVGCWSVLQWQLTTLRPIPLDVRYIGPGMWLMLLVLIAQLTAALWDRDEDIALPALIGVGLSLPFLLTGVLAESVQGFAVLAGTMSIVLLALSIPFWLQRTALATDSGKWSRGLLLSGALVVVIVVGLASFAAVVRDGTRISVTLAVALSCVAVVGHALWERSCNLLMLAGLLLNLTASLAVWQMTLPLSAADSWPYLIQANLIACACVPLVWLRFPRRFSPSWPPSDIVVTQIAAQTAFAVAGLVLLLLAPLYLLFVDPTLALPVDLQRIGEVGGWVAWAVVFGAAYWFSSHWKPDFTTHILGIAGLAFAVQVAIPAGWLTLLTVCVLLGLAWMSVLILSARRMRDTSAPALWVEILAFVLVLFGVRGIDSVAGLPWTSAGPVLLAAVLFGSIAIVGNTVRHVWTSGLSMVAAVMLAWWQWGVLEFESFTLMLASALAVAGVVWSYLSLRNRLDTSFPNAAALSGLGMLGLLVVVGWKFDGSDPSLFRWLSVTLVAVAFIARLWDERARATLAGLYTLGLIAIVFVLQGQTTHPERLVTIATILLAVQVMVATEINHLCGKLERLCDRLGLASWVTSGPNSELWLTAQQMLAALSLLLGLGLSTATVDWPHRAAGALATLLIMQNLLRFASTLSGKDRAMSRRAGLALGPMLLMQLCFIGLDPIEVIGPVHHAAYALVAFVVCGLVYREVFPVAAWRDDARKVSTGLFGVALFVLVALVGIEMRTFDLQTMRTPLTVFEMTIAALAIALLLGQSLREAMKPPGRPAFVYAAELLLVVLFVHLRWNIPLVRGMTSASTWPFQVMILAFAGAALAEVFRRRGLDVLAGPLHNTGLALPLLPLLAFWLRPSPEMLEAASMGTPGLAMLLAPLQYVPEEYSTQAFLWFVTALLLLGIALARQSLAYTIAAALTANVGLWMLLTHHGIGLLIHPQLWLVPLGLIVLLAEYVNRDQLRPEQRLALRYTGLLLLYVSSTADLFIHGVGSSVWLPLALAVLSVVGVLAGILLRVRAFLFMGLLFLLIDVMSMIWHAAVERTQTWVWYVSGIVLGGAILAMFAVFEKRRDDVLRLVEDIKKWE